MDKLAGRIIDFNDDPRFVSDLRAQGLYGHELVDIDKLEKLPDSAFAVKIASGGHTHRRFPIHNKTATLLSAQYFDAARQDDVPGHEQLPAEIAKVAGWHIGQACERFGLDWPETAKGSVDPGTTAVTLVDEGVPAGFATLDKLAEHTHGRIAQAFDHMQPEQRFIAVNELVKVANHEAITDRDLWDYVPKAHLGPNFVQGMKDRETLVKRAGQGQRSLLAGPLFDELSGDLREADPVEAPRLLGQFDKLAELDLKYKDGLPDPYQTCWGGFALPKEARASFGSSVDQMLAPKEDRDSAEGYLVDLELRYPKHDVSFPKLAAVAQATVDDRPWPDNYKTAVRRHFA
jgi:hypothetical protein